MMCNIFTEKNLTGSFSAEISAQHVIFWLSFKLANYTPYNIIVYPRAGILCVQKSEFLIEVYLHRVFITTARFAIFIDSHVHAVLAEHNYAITNTNVCNKSTTNFCFLR